MVAAGFIMKMPLKIPLNPPLRKGDLKALPFITPLF
jgi:hypothetical protein